MRVALDWGGQHLNVEIATQNLVVVRRQDPAPALADPAEAVRAALESPADFPPLRRALTPDDHLGIVVDEHVPQLGRLLVPILEHIHSAGVSADAITLLCLPPTTGQTWLEELPDEFQDARVEVHQPGDRRKLAYLATTKHGRRIYLNRSAVDADQLILLTRRSYDPILGYGGAAGALYPGLSDEATQHEIAGHFRLEAPGHERWPVQREAAEVAWLLGAPFLIQVIQGSGDDIVHVLAGSIESSREGERLLDARWRVTVDRPADVVVSGLRTAANTLAAEDLARAYFAAARVVRSGGRIVLLTGAAPALGPALQLLRQSEDMGPALQRMLQEKPEDLAAGFMWASAAQHAKLYLLSGLADEVAEELFVTPLERASEVQRLLSGEAACLLLPDLDKTLATVEDSAP
jgi:nickel-dependent lactate racemase